MKFKNRIDVFFVSTLLLVILASVDASITEYQKGNYSHIIIMLCIGGIPIFPLLLLIFKRNGRYEINHDFMHYKMLLLKGKIKISDIKRIEVNKTLWVGLKASSSLNGLIIHYGKYDEIAISPEKQDLFVNELLKHNSNIELVDHKRSD